MTSSNTDNQKWNRASGKTLRGRGRPGSFCELTDRRCRELRTLITTSPPQDLSQQKLKSQPISSSCCWAVSSTSREDINASNFLPFPPGPHWTSSNKWKGFLPETGELHVYKCISDVGSEWPIYFQHFLCKVITSFLRIALFYIICN